MKIETTIMGFFGTTIRIHKRHFLGKGSGSVGAYG